MLCSGTAIGNEFGHPPRGETRRRNRQRSNGSITPEMLGAPVIGVPRRSPTKGTIGGRRPRRLMVWAIEGVLGCAGQHGVRLALENHGRPTATAEGLLKFVPRRCLILPSFGDIPGRQLSRDQRPIRRVGKNSLCRQRPGEGRHERRIKRSPPISNGWLRLCRIPWRDGVVAPEADRAADEYRKSTAGGSRSHAGCRGSPIDSPSATIGEAMAARWSATTGRSTTGAPRGTPVSPARV